jgi:ATP-dependent 26S proteasome regulatory subunit
MTVKDLMERLKEFDQDWSVEIVKQDEDGEDFYEDVGGVEVAKIPYGAFTIWKVRIF